MERYSPLEILIQTYLINYWHFLVEVGNGVFGGYLKGVNIVGIKGYSCYFFIKLLLYYFT